MTTAENDVAPVFSLCGGEVLGPEGVAPGDVHVADGLLSARARGGRRVDARGYLILPGIVDLHGDGFERHLAPRRGALDSLDAGVGALDAELAANGITTAILAQFFSWEGGMRGPAYAEAVAGAVAQADTRTDLRLQLRLEINMIDDYPRALSLIERHKIGYVVFNDHLPHDALAKGKRPPRLTGQALKAGRAPEVHLALMQTLHARRAEVGPALATLSDTLRAHDVRLGSHDDATPADRDRFRALGAQIAEFPETEAAALAAHGAGDTVVMGAPNVVRGGSHDGKVAAADLVARGAVDALVSDYHYPAPLRAVWRLVDAGLPLHRAWDLVSTRPATVMGFGDRGRIAPDLQADLVVLRADSRRVEGTIAGGRFSFLSGALAARVLGAAECD